MGTPFYMAPEQVFGETHLDARVDVWAAGVMLYECLTGERPFTGENVGQIFRQISKGTYRPIREVISDPPADLEAMIERMLKHNREDRVGSLAEVLRELEHPRTVPPITAPVSEGTLMTPATMTNGPFERTPSGLTRELIHGSRPLLARATRTRASATAPRPLVATSQLCVPH